MCGPASWIETTLLTGSEDCTLKVWTLTNLKKSEQDKVSIHVDHTFHGHSKSVEVTWFGHGKDSLQLCFSVGLDDKIKVWSIQMYTVVYTVDMHLLDCKGLRLFPSKTAGKFAICATSEGRSQVMIARFTSEVSEPFAMSNDRAVNFFGRCSRGILPTLSPNPRAILPFVLEDQTLHILNCESRETIVTLPSPPQGTVRVKQVYMATLCGVLHTILWLSSNEVVIFQLKVGPHTTLRMLRRFDIEDISVALTDTKRHQEEENRDIKRETFTALGIYHGRLVKQQHTTSLFKSVPLPTLSEDGAFLILGTILGSWIILDLEEISAHLVLYARYALPHTQILDLCQGGHNSVVCLDSKPWLVVWDLHTLTRLFEHRLAEPIFVPYIVGDTVCGVCVGVDVKIELYLQNGVVSAAASHAKKVRQLDYCARADVFASIALDNAVKIWEARTLRLLMSVAYPDTLTAIVFRPMSEGDILLGFANHVEILTRAYWRHAAQLRDDKAEWSGQEEDEGDEPDLAEFGRQDVGAENANEVEYRIAKKSSATVSEEDKSAPPRELEDVRQYHAPQRKRLRYGHIGALLGPTPSPPCRIPVEPYVLAEVHTSRLDPDDLTHAQVPIVETPFVDSCGSRDICLRGKAGNDGDDIVLVTSIGYDARRQWSPRDVVARPTLRPETRVVDSSPLRERPEMAQVDSSLWVRQADQELYMSETNQDKTDIPTLDTRRASFKLATPRTSPPTERRSIEPPNFCIVGRAPSRDV